MHSLDACVWIQSQIIIIIKRLKYPGWSNASLVHPNFGRESLWKTVISCKKTKQNEHKKGDMPHNQKTMIISAE